MQNKEEFINEAVSKHGTKFDYSKVEYVNNSTKVCIICPIHGEFWQTPYEHVHSVYGCKKCSFSRNTKNIEAKEEQFIKDAISVHGYKYDYSKVKYKNSDTKVCIICPEHGEFWQTPYKHVHRKHGCSKCSGNHKLSAQEFIERSNKIHNFKYDYSDVIYEGGLKKIKIICPIHGEFFQTAYHHLQGRGCPKCACEQISQKNTKPKESFITKANIQHGYKYTYDNVSYINRRTKVLITCSIHGDFSQVPKDHLDGCGCPKCADELRGKNRVLTTDEFIKRAKEIHGDLYNYDKCTYVNIYTPVLIICPKHGDFYQSPQAHIQQKCGCPKCKLKSQADLFTKLQQQFPNETILYEATNKHVKWLGRKRLDIYFPKYNIAVEYDGQQHFMPITKFGGEIHFQKTVEADKYKNELCAANNCMLFRVKYGYTDSDFVDLINKIKCYMKQYLET